MKLQSTYYPAANQAYWPFLSSSWQRRAQAKRLRSEAFSLKNWLQSLLFELRSSTDPHVWETCTTAGETVWSARDTVSGKTIYNVSESEIRAWLEERHQF